MILISRAKKEDLPAIQHLMRMYGNKCQVEKEHLNHKDIALQARLDSGELVGFLWVGLMANNSLGYIDKFAVDSNYSGKKIGNQLAHAMLKEVNKRKVKQVFGIIKQDQYHDKSAINALKMAIRSDVTPYTYVIADLNMLNLELKEI